MPPKDNQLFTYQIIDFRIIKKNNFSQNLQPDILATLILVT